jgi:hypothetical protein
VHRGAERPIDAADQLALEYLLADLDAGPAWPSIVLVERHHQSFR